MKTYLELKRDHEKELNEFPIAFAFSQKQLDEALIKLNAEKKDCLSIGMGGIIKKTDLPAFEALIDKHDQDFIDCFKDDNLLIDAIVYELGNHEFCITYDISDTVDCLGLNMNDERIKNCMQKARKIYWENREGTN